jgi:hypothetical protein
MLMKNETLAFLNIADNGVRNEGLKHISEGMCSDNCHLVSLNISNNDLEANSINMFEKIL